MPTEVGMKTPCSKNVQKVTSAGLSDWLTYLAAQTVPLGLATGTPTALPYSVQEPS